MAAQTDVGTNPVLVDYLTRAGDHDELARHLADTALSQATPSLHDLDQRDWQQRQRSLNRLIRAEGITYGLADPGRSARSWQVDILPLYLGASEWTELEAGLRQRTELLDLVLADLFGPRRLLRERVLPPELVVGHDGFLPGADQIVVPGRHQLLLTAADLVRDQNGQWTVLSDRTQSPTGMGYAMANRRLISRILDRDYRGAPIHRLRGFFDRIRIALENAAPSDVDNPRVVMLSPGPASETAYDQALVSTLVGHPIVQGGDLEINDGRLWLRTISRRQPVHVVARRVDASYSDSLDLRSDSRLGVPGLLEAARRQRVSVANHFGSGVLENTGLLAHLDAVAEFLLGERLILPTVPTWWCGEPEGLAYTLAHLDELMIKPIARTLVASSVRGWQLADADRDLLVAAIKAEPWRWTSQQPITPSTAPVLSADGFQPRRVVLRTFGVSAGESYDFLPGGLARVASEDDQWLITNSTGALSKDVWVLQDLQKQLQPIEVDHYRGVQDLVPATPGLPPSAADNLYWLGRYAERTEATARMLKVADQLIEDNLQRPATPGHTAMRAILSALSMVTGVGPGFVGDHAEQRLRDPLPQMRIQLLDADRPGTIAHSAARTAAAANDVRELLSFDTFSVLNALQTAITTAQADVEDAPLQPVIVDVLRSSLAFAGLSNESLTRDEIWAFVEVGRRMERAQTTVRMLRHTLAHAQAPVAEALLTESVLSVGDSLITYRRRMAANLGARVAAESALDLLLLDADNPRSVRFQIDRMAEAFDHAPNPSVDRRVAEILEDLAQAGRQHVLEGDRAAARALLDDLDLDLRALSDQIQAAHFVTQPPAIAFSVPARVEDHHGD